MKSSSGSRANLVGTAFVDAPDAVRIEGEIARPSEEARGGEAHVGAVGFSRLSAGWITSGEDAADVRLAKHVSLDATHEEVLLILVEDRQGSPVRTPLLTVDILRRLSNKMS